MNLMTKNGDRPDLEAIATNMPEGYIATKLFPVKKVSEKSGSISVMDVTADLTAQTGRSAGASINSTIVAKQAVAFTCVRTEGRAEFDFSETPDSEGIAGIDNEGGRLVKRCIAGAIESAAAAQIFNAGNAAVAITAATGEIIPAIQDAAEAVKGVEGALALVVSRDMYAQFIRLDEVKNSLDVGVYTQLLNMSASAQLSKNASFMVNLLQTVYPFEMILVGDNAYWKSNTYGNYMAVVKVPTESPKMVPTLGQTMVYIPDGVTGTDQVPVKITSYANMDKKTNTYDGEAWVVCKTFNAEGVKLIDVSADVNITTTSTTTGTTTTTA